MNLLWTFHVATKFRTHYILIFACRHEGKESEEHDEPGNHPRKSHDGVTFNKSKNAANSRGGVRPSACSCEAFGSMSGAKWRPDGARPPKFFPYVLCFTFQPRLHEQRHTAARGKQPFDASPLFTGFAGATKHPVVCLPFCISGMSIFHIGNMMSVFVSVEPHNDMEDSCTPDKCREHFSVALGPHHTSDKVGSRIPNTSIACSLHADVVGTS